jgi:hypothetical protein
VTHPNHDPAWADPAAQAYVAPQPPAEAQPQYAQPRYAEPQPYAGLQPYPDVPYQGAPYPGGQYGYPGYVPTQSHRTNSLAIASLICSIAGCATYISAPVGAILGHIARRQIRERGESGDGMALAGIIVGWTLTGLYLGMVVLFVVLGLNGLLDDPSYSS